MCLGQVNATRAHFLPQVGNRIQTNESRPLLDVKQQHVQHVEQHCWVGIIQVHLIGTERGPHVPRAAVRLDGGQQGQTAGTRDRRQIRGRVHFDKVVCIACLPRQVALKPGALP